MIQAGPSLRRSWTTLFGLLEGNGQAFLKRGDLTLEATHEFKPEIVGISCLISSCINTLQETISHLKANTPREIAPRAYVAGGRLLNQRVGKAVGADLCTMDAMEGVRLCQQAMKGRRSPGSTP